MEEKLMTKCCNCGEVFPLYNLKYVYSGGMLVPLCPQCYLNAHTLLNNVTERLFASNPSAISTKVKAMLSGKKNIHIRCVDGMTEETMAGMITTYLKAYDEKVDQKMCFRHIGSDCAGVLCVMAFDSAGAKKHIVYCAYNNQYVLLLLNFEDALWEFVREGNSITWLRDNITRKPVGDGNLIPTRKFIL